LADKYDPGFGKVIKWDIPLLEGYAYQFLDNRSTTPGSHHFNGIINPDILAQIDAWQPDALLVYGWSLRSHLKVLVHYKNKIPVFFRGDSTLLDDKPGLKAFARRLVLRWVYRHIDKAFYVGSNNKAYFKALGLKEDQLIYAPHAIANDFFQDKGEAYETAAAKWRQELGIPEEAFVFLFVGKLELKKAPLLLIEAFKSAVFSIETHLIIVGDGLLESALKNAGNRKEIHFISFQNQKRMPVVYRLADTVVLPSGGPGETWGLVINEAMACGKPVIASTKCGGAADLIKEDVNGYVFGAGDQEELKEKLQKIARDKARSREMGNAAFAGIQNFSFLKSAEAIEGAMEALRKPIL
jgi:glycosyltransferase involved in cell wall biosynthesis